MLFPNKFRMVADGSIVAYDELVQPSRMGALVRSDTLLRARNHQYAHNIPPQRP